MELNIRPLVLDELNAVADVHTLAFSSSALTKLGKEPVRRYYEWQMIGPHDALTIGAFQGEKLIGFCVGGVFRGALGGFLKKNRNYLIRQVLTHPWFLFNPLFRERAQFALSRIFRFLPIKKHEPITKMQTQIESSKSEPSFSILSIAVAPQHHGSGAAKLLMEYSEQVALERGFARMGLSVHPSNGRAVRFYEKMGWQKDEVNGIWSGHMSKILTTSER